MEFHPKMELKMIPANKLLRMVLLLPVHHLKLPLTKKTIEPILLPPRKLMPSLIWQKDPNELERTWTMLNLIRF